MVKDVLYNYLIDINESCVERKVKTNVDNSKHSKGSVELHTNTDIKKI